MGGGTLEEDAIELLNLLDQMLDEFEILLKDFKSKDVELSHAISTIRIISCYIYN